MKMWQNILQNLFQRCNNWGGQFKLIYNGEKLSASVGFATQNQIAKYSLDPTANMNTWDSSVMSEILYTPDKGWEFQNELNYNFYHGYSAGFGRPEVQWVLGISKAIKSVTLGLKVSNILNQTRNMNRIVTADYVKDRYKNVLGRYFFFNVTFNFGKVNAKKNAGAVHSNELFAAKVPILPIKNSEKVPILYLKNT